MAASSSISNFFSFRLPAKPRVQPPQFPLSSPSLTRFPSSQRGNNLVVAVGSAYNVQVVVEDNESEERLLNRFRREVMRAGVIQECKRRRFFENKQDEKKRKSREAAKRNRRNRYPRRPMGKSPGQNKQDVPITKKEEDDDNWDLPEGDTLNF